MEVEHPNSERKRLPNRRACETFGFDCAALRYTATISRFDDGRISEIFISNHKSGSQADTNAKDSAVVCSIAPQYGVPVSVIRKALLLVARGAASSPLGTALDILAAAPTRNDFHDHEILF
jgi:hypothetical protein